MANDIVGAKTGLQVGKIIRRGMNGLTPVQYNHLLENADQVEDIIKEIEARRQQYLKAEADALARLAEAEKKEADVDAKISALEEAKAALVWKERDIKIAHEKNMDALHRRTQEVLEKEKVAETRASELDARSKEIEGVGRDREAELEARVQDAVAREAAVEKADVAVLARKKDLDDRARRIQTAEKLVRQAVGAING